MKVLFCDQALIRFGYSVYETASEICSLQTYGLLLLNGKLGYMGRLEQIENWLIEFIDEHNIGIVVIEEVQFQRNVQTYRKLCILHYVLEAACLKKGIPFEKLNVSTWRKSGVKSLLGLSDGGKHTLYTYLFYELGQPDSFDDNQSDSIGMGIYWCHRNFPNATIDWLKKT